nr:copia protein [Tanacetum cinerariifolium]
MLDHQDKYMMEAQHILRKRLLASFQDLEHEGGDTKSQGGIKDNDSKIKIQDLWRTNDHSNEFPRTRLQVSRKDDPHKSLKDKEIVDSGCSRHMTWNKAHLVDYQEFKGGFVAFGGSNGVVTDFNNLATTMHVNPTPTTRTHTVHPKTQILGDPLSTVQTRSKVPNNSEAHALKAIGTKWVYMNKKDERGVVVRNKARLVAQGHRQEEGIDYDEVSTLVAKIKAIRIFLAFASYMGFIVYQMDVKSAFLYGTIDEEVYVTQPPGFVDPKFPNKVYKEKSRYRRGAIDKTLFIKQDKKDIMLVQVYVNDIIFGSTKKSWCDEFEELMKNRFQISFMGEITFFLGLQVKQKEDGIFISQDKYVAEILKKFDFLSVKTASVKPT